MNVTDKCFIGIVAFCFGIVPASAREISQPMTSSRLPHLNGRMLNSKALQQNQTSSRRSNFFYGKLLNAEDFDRDQEYFRRDRQAPPWYEQVSGLSVGLESGRGSVKVTISAGQAVTKLGESVVLPSALLLEMPPVDGKYYVVLCTVLREEGRHCQVLAEIDQRAGRARIVRNKPQ